MTFYEVIKIDTKNPVYSSLKCTTSDSQHPRPGNLRALRANYLELLDIHASRLDSVGSEVDKSCDVG
jgi:hypothetical protein